jgi:hypothetical protein
MSERWSLTSAVPSALARTAVVEPRRVRQVVEALATQPPGPPEARLCAAAVKLLDAAGVGLSLGASVELLDCGLQTICATDGARDGETRQFDLGEGPSYTAHRTGWPVQVPDLERDDTWPAFADAAAAFGFVPCLPFRCDPVQPASAR